MTLTAMAEPRAIIDAINEGYEEEEDVTLPASPARRRAVSPACARVLIVAAFASVRAGLHALLEAEPGIDVRGDAPAVGDTLTRLLPAVHPDVVLVDLGGGSEGSSDPLGRVLDAIDSALLSPSAVVALGDSPHRDLPRLQRADLPGWGYLSPEADGPRIAAAVRAAAAGLVALDPSLPLPFASPAGGDAAETRRPGAVGADEEPFAEGNEPLTPREMEVLQLMAEGLPNKLIAARLGITLHTAKFHVAQILGKLDAASRTEAVTLGARRGFVIL